MCEFGKRGGDIAKDFAIDMLFDEEDDRSTLMWCQGKMMDFIKESKENHVFVKIEWSDKCVREGDLKIMKNQLKKDEMESELTRWCIAWREDLYHKLMNKE